MTYGVSGGRGSWALGIPCWGSTELGIRDALLVQLVASFLDFHFIILLHSLAAYTLDIVDT